jgi:phosphoglycolate phosphatase
MIQLIIYDLDGTLIDSRRDIANAVNGTLREMGLGELSVEQVSSFVGNGVTNLMQQALKESTTVVGAPLVGAR